MDDLTEDWPGSCQEAAPWSDPEGADPGDLLAQARVRVAELERAGLLDLRHRIELHPK